MATKKENKRYIVRKVRRILNSTQVLPEKVSGDKYIHSGWGGGATRSDIACRDGSEDPYDYDLEFFFYQEEDFYTPDTEDGVWWTFDAANDPEPVKLGELFAA